MADDDPRFTKFQTDPKFRGLAKKNRRVKIDDRFQSLFKDPQFLNKVSIDKRGRPESTFNAQENYKRYYQLDQDDEDDDDEHEGDEDQARDPEPDGAQTLPMTDMSVDYARGEGLASDSSSEDDDDSSDDDEPGPPAGSHGSDPSTQAEEVFDKWGELDHDAPRTESISARLAVCNMDWDRVGAEDLFLAMASFCPSSGRVRSVRIYLSDFGRQRLADEERLGPEELRSAPTGTALESDQSEPDEDVDEDEAQLDSVAMERVRRYQVNRLKYYYAVVEFDSPTSANQVYEECDGHEYELSATRFDLRFIPDDMEFEAGQAQSECLTTPNPDTYQPKVFQTTALQQGKVDLTWDETDPDRLAAMQRAFTMNSDDDEANDAHVQALVAGGASSDEDHEDRSRSRAIGSGSEDDDDPQDSIAKYKALLNEINESKQQKRQVDADMEMTWTTSDPQPEAQATRDPAQMTPWEQYLHKKKTKKQAKREQSKKNQEQDNPRDNGQEEDDVPSDVDLDDPFFRSELAEGNVSDSETEMPMPKKKSKKALKKDKKAKAVKANEENGGDGETRADLGLLVMDSDDEKGHFDYKDIVEREKGKKAKKGRKRKNPEEKDPVAEDVFEMDLQDDRFAAVFHNADFNVDPSHPSFKKTKSMQQVINEKQRRILQSDSRAAKAPKTQISKTQPHLPTSTTTKSRQNDHLDVLVKAIKAKTGGAKTTSKKGNKKRKASNA